MGNNRYQIDMLSGSLAKKMLIFALPLIASSLLQQMFNTADIIVVGRFAGAHALASVGACGSLINLFVTFFVGFSLGSNIVISRATGRKDFEHVHKSVHTAILFALLCGLLMAVTGFSLARRMLNASGVPDDIIDLATVYMRIYFLGTPASLLYNFGASILRTQGDTKRPLFFLTAAGILNVGLNLFFVIVLHMSAAGVALATILSQYLSAVLVIRCLILDKGYIRLEPRKLHIHKSHMLEILRAGLPAGLENSMYSISNVVIQSAINSFGSTVVAAGSAVSNINGILSVPNASINQTVVTFSSQNRGAEKYDRIDRALLTGMLYSSSFSLLLGVSAAIFGRQLLSVYAPGETEVIQEGLLRLRCMMPFLFCAGILGSLASTLRGLGYSISPTSITLVGTCIFRLIWVATVLPLHRTTLMLYIIWPITWTITAIVMGIYFLNIRKKVYPKKDAPLAAS